MKNKLSTPMWYGRAEIPVRGFKLAEQNDEAAATRPQMLNICHRDAQTITDVCSGGDLPEVEIVSLLQESIPRYTLRADSLVEFSGYENQDWFIPTPALKLENAQLSPDQIRETLNYFRE
ncbi:unnamed protein product [Bemisia tabaci]|uniref:HAP1 N-terminal domain-containing protein n=1 Tax=Bemisia tabaci TaxID=7038 RepID=A0A9P0F9M5_BEMTA|nr:unnamed protein product [Bemisia tabaci]